MSAWVAVIAAGAGCYALRLSMLVVLGAREPSADTVRRAGYVMPAAFASLAAAALMSTADAGSAHATAPAVGAVVTATVAARTSSSTFALLAGLAAAALASTIAPL